MNHFPLNIAIIIYSGCTSIFLILLLVSYAYGKTKVTFQTFININLLVISIIELFNYMYYFESEFYPPVVVPFLCKLQSSIGIFIQSNKIPLISIISHLLKVSFINADKTNYICHAIFLIIFGYLIPGTLFFWSINSDDNNVDITGYCRFVYNKNAYVLLIYLSYYLFWYMFFFYNMFKLRSLIKQYCNNREIYEKNEETEGKEEESEEKEEESKENEEEEEEDNEYLNEISRYNKIIGTVFIKIVNDGIIKILHYNTIFESNENIFFIYSIIKKGISLLVLTVFALGFNLNEARLNTMLKMICCKKEKKEIQFFSLLPN